RGWVVLEFPREYTIDRVVWGRDREGKFDDRLATSYTIEIADTAGAWCVVADATDRQKYVRENAKIAPFSTAGLSSDDAKQATTLMQEKRALEAKINVAEVGQKV